MDNRELVGRLREAAENVVSRHQDGEGIYAMAEDVFALCDALEASEADRERLERQNARLQVQLDTANHALEKAVRGE